MSMSGAARLVIHVGQNSARRKCVLSCKAKYNPMKIGICKSSTQQLPNGLTPCLR